MCQKKIIIFLQKLESLRILIFKLFCDKIYKALLKNKEKKMVKLNGEFIETVGMTSSGKVKIVVTLADSHDYAMEVNVYEHN